VTVTALDTRRRLTIGGSRAASACGVDPYRSRVMLWWEMLNGVEREDTEAMQLGRLLQPVIAEAMGAQGFDLMPAPADGFVHPSEKWMVVHPDALTAVDGAQGIGEIKTRGTGWRSEDEHELFPYVMQLQHGLAVTGLDVAVLGVLHGGYGGLRLVTRVYERDESLIARMVDLEADLLQHVRTARQPSADGSKSTADAIHAMHSESDGSAKHASGEVWEWVQDARHRKMQRDECDRQYKELVQNIQLFMGSAETLISPHDTKVARWPTVRKNRFATKRFSAAHPALYSEFLEQGSERRFTLT